MVLIPENTKLDNVCIGKEKNNWIIWMLKQAARIPHQSQSWPGIGHSHYRFL